MIEAYILIAGLTGLHALLDGNGVVGSLIAVMICPIYWVLYVVHRF